MTEGNTRNTAPNPDATARNRRLLLAMFAIAFLTLGGSYLLFYGAREGGVWGTTNQGEFVDPPVIVRLLFSPGEEPDNVHGNTPRRAGSPVGQSGVPRQDSRRAGVRQQKAVRGPSTERACALAIGDGNAVPSAVRPKGVHGETPHSN